MKMIAKLDAFTWYQAENDGRNEKYGNSEDHGKNPRNGVDEKLRYSNHSGG